MTQVTPNINVNFDRYSSGMNVFVPAHLNKAFQAQNAQQSFCNSPAPQFANQYVSGGQTGLGNSLN